MTDIAHTDTAHPDIPTTAVVTTGTAAEPGAALDARIWVAWLALKGARVVAESRPDPENSRTREQAERYLDTLLDTRLTATDRKAPAPG